MSKIDKNKLFNLKKEIINNSQAREKALSTPVTTGDTKGLVLFFTQLKEAHDGNLTEIFDTRMVFNLLVPLVRYNKNLSLIKCIVNNLGTSVLSYKKPDDNGTLIGEASLYGAEKIVKYFLNTKKVDPDIAGIEGKTPLHQAVITNQEEVIKVLIEAKANLNSFNDDKHTPLHLAAIYRHSNLYPLLKKAGADLKIKEPHGYTYDKLHNIYMHPEETVLKTPTQPSQEDIRFSFFLKGVLSDGEKPQFFDLVINICKKPLKKTKEGSPHNLSTIKSALCNLLLLYEYYKQDELKVYILTTAKKHKLNSILAFLYNQLAIDCMAEADYYSAYEHAKNAYEYWHKEKDSEQQEESIENILLNLGVTAKYFNLQKSLEYFNELEKLSPGNQDAIREKCEIYESIGDFKNASIENNKIKDLQLKNLLTLRFQVYNTFIDDEQYERITDFNIEELKNSESKYTIYADILAKLHIKKGEFDKVKQLYKNGISKANSVPHQLIKILDEYSKAGLWEYGLQTLKEFYTEYPEILTNHQHYNLKYLEFLFFEFNSYEAEAEACLNFLQSFSTKGERLFNLYSSAKIIGAHNAINNRQYQKALNYLGKEDKDNKKIIKLINWLQEAEAEQEKSHKVSSEKEAEKESDRNADTNQTAIDWAQILKN